MKLFSHKSADENSMVVGIRYQLPNGQERLIKQHLGVEAMEKMSPESVKNHLLHMAEADRRKHMGTNDGNYAPGVAGLAASFGTPIQQQLGAAWGGGYPQQMDAMAAEQMQNYTKMFYTNGTNTNGSWKIAAADWESDTKMYDTYSGKIGITAEGLLQAKQMMQGCRRFKFPALNGFSTYDEGAEMKGVDLLRHRCAKWLGTVVAS